MRKQRRIALKDASDSILTGYTMDITQLDNANTSAVMRMEVQELCDMGHWHRLSLYQLSPWGRALEDPYK
jgi:hypothetical protein